MLYHGLNLHCQFWERAGKHCSLCEFMAGNPQGGEREALNDCTWHNPIPRVAQPYPQDFIRAFQIRSLPIALPCISLDFAGHSLPSCARWGAHGGLCSVLRCLHVSRWALAHSFAGAKSGHEGLCSMCSLCGLPYDKCLTAKVVWWREL